MRDRNSPPTPPLRGAPASMLEGVFGDDLPDEQHLAAWGRLAVVSREHRALLAMPVIEDVPFDPPPASVDDPADTEARCVGEHHGGPVESETPVFDILGTIRGVQERLVWLGYGSALNGKLDAATRRALALFQEEAGVPISEFPDEATRIALGRRTTW